MPARPERPGGRGGAKAGGAKAGDAKAGHRGGAKAGGAERTRGRGGPKAGGSSAASKPQAAKGAATKAARQPVTRGASSKAASTSAPAGARVADSASPARRGAGGTDGVRLQKVMASAGLGSRRACEDLIAAGRVEVDGRLVTEQGLRVDPSTAEVRVDGVRLPTAPGHVVIALNKPRGVLSTMHDDRGRRCVGDLVADRKERLFHVGRLDADTEGLLLLTNDGDLAHRLAHPSHGVHKTYLARVSGPIPRGLGARLRAGVELEDGPVAVDRFRVVSAAGDEVLVEVVLHEGRKHVVRRLLAEVGHPVRGLVRTRVGPIALGELRPGQQRMLSTTEVGALFSATE